LLYGFSFFISVSAWVLVRRISFEALDRRNSFSCRYRSQAGLETSQLKSVGIVTRLVTWSLDSDLFIRNLEFQFTIMTLAVMAVTGKKHSYSIYMILGLQI